MLQPIIYLPAVGLTKLASLNVIPELELAAQHKLTGQFLTMLSMEGAGFQNIPKNVSAFEPATANADVS